jgi:hypothetical protein
MAFIKAEVTVVADSASADDWKRYRNERRNNFRKPLVPAPALDEEWGPQSFAYYSGLPRAHSSILFQCRSGKIGLKPFLHSKNGKSIILSETDQCPCNNGMHTA